VAARTLAKRAPARDLKPSYTAPDADAAQRELERFDERWGQRFPVITQPCLDACEHVIPFRAFPPEVRRVIYTTDENVKERGSSVRASSWSR
jgi:transposase-like protein